MLVKSVPTVGWTRGDIEATIRLVSQEQRQALAARVRAAMEAQNLDNVRLARKSGVAEKTISRIINARVAPRYSTLERLSKALTIKDPDLWTGIGLSTSDQRPVETPDLSHALSADIRKELRRELRDLNLKLDAIISVLDDMRGDEGDSRARGTAS